MNIEIIPNWHPIFVHFTVGLLSISALLYLAGLLLKKPHLFIIARWNLWIGGVITIITVLAGFDAYNTVAHDGPSHAAMTDHKNWALVTASIFGLLTLWSLVKHRGAKTVSIGFVVLILFASSLLAVTGFKGGEAVYRYGLGVMSIPEVSGDGGHGSHSHGGNSDTGHHGMENQESQPHENHADADNDRKIETSIPEEAHDHGAHAH